MTEGSEGSALTIRFSWLPPSMVLFDSFLPSESGEALHFEIPEFGFLGRMFVLDDQLEDEMELSVERNDAPGLAVAMLAPHIRGALRFEIEIIDPNPEADLIRAIENSDVSEVTGRYGERLVRVVASVQESVIHFLRFRAEHYWLESHDLLAGYDEVQSYLDKHKARWRRGNAEWSRLLLGADSMRLSAIVFSDGVTREAWSDFSNQLTKSRRSPMWQVLVANALEHLVQRNQRLAVVEAVMALEAVVKETFPARVVELVAGEERGPTPKAVRKALKASRLPGDLGDICSASSV